MNSAANTTESFVPQEVAFRKLTVRGAGTWKRKIIKTEKAFDAFIASHSENWEVETRDAEEALVAWESAKRRA